MRAIKLVSMPFALAFLIGAGLLLPGAAQATTPSATLHLSSKLFPTGAPAADGVSGTIPASPGGAVKLTAPQYLYEPAVPPATTPTVYEFAFWNANAKLEKTANATFHVPNTGTAFDATAWYLPIGGGCQTVCPPELNTWAFSLTKDEVLPGTPIGKVSPLSAGWTSPSTTVSTATAVEGDGPRLLRDIQQVQISQSSIHGFRCLAQTSTPTVSTSRCPPASRHTRSPSTTSTPRLLRLLRHISSGSRPGSRPHSRL